MTWQQIVGTALMAVLSYMMYRSGRKVGRDTALIGVLDALQDEISERKSAGSLREDHMKFAASFFERIKEL